MKFPEDIVSSNNLAILIFSVVQYIRIIPADVAYNYTMLA